jgi:hypothetical protein
LEELLVFQVKLTVWVGSEVPVPVRSSTVEDGTALLAKVSVPLVFPVACGLNVTVKVALFPAAIFAGMLIPLKENRELLLLAELIVTSAPLAVSVPWAVPSAPTATLPKFKVVGLTANFALVVVPVPLRFSVVVEDFALLSKVSVPLTAPLDFGWKLTVKETLWPSSITAGSDKPLSANSELLLLAEVTLTFPPVAVSVPVAVPVLPTVTFPRLSVVGPTVNCVVAATPFPLRAATVVGGEALLEKVSLALVEPLDCGWKFTVKDALLPSAIVSGIDNPLNAKLELLLLAEVMVTLPDEAVSVPVAVLLPPTFTLPKLSVPGVTANFDGRKPMPVADKGTARVEFEAFDVIATLPLAFAEVLEVNTTEKCALWPADRVNGRLSPLALNPSPVTGACVITTVEVPLLVTVAVCDWLTPACTPEKATLAGVTLNWPAAAVCDVELMVDVFAGALVIPWQPIIAKAKTAATEKERAVECLGVAFMCKLSVLL